MEEALQNAADANQPFDVVHFDGHGVYDQEHGVGALCFEDPNETEKLERRKMQLVHDVAVLHHMLGKKADDFETVQKLASALIEVGMYDQVYSDASTKHRQRADDASCRKEESQ